MPNIHIHFRWNQHHQTAEGITLEPAKMVNVPAEVQEITNGHW
jgi:hypothetical protein